MHTWTGALRGAEIVVESAHEENFCGSFASDGVLESVVRGEPSPPPPSSPPSSSRLRQNRFSVYRLV
jgi:hypothetical protein